METKEVIDGIMNKIAELRKNFQSECSYSDGYNDALNYVEYYIKNIKL